MLDRLASELRYRFRALFRQNTVERELDEELRFHLERDIEQRVRSGTPRAEAARLARVALGGVAQVKGEAREARGVAFLEHLGRDLRFTMRSLRRRKAFSIGIVVTLALGIGVNATMFGIVDRLLFRAPPMMRDPGSVHRIYRFSLEDGVSRPDRNLAFPTFLDLRRTTSSFTDIAAFQTRPLPIGEGEETRELLVTYASANYFRFFDTRPVLGRFFTEEEDRVPAGAPVAVLGYGYWQTEFGGRDVIGQSLTVGRALCTIVGVAPPDFVGITEQGVPAVYFPISTYAFSLRGAGYADRYGWSWLELIARRKPGVAQTAAETDLSAALVRSWRNAAAEDPGWGSPERQEVRGHLGPVQLGRGPQAGQEVRVAAWVGGVALIVLLIACANIANLLLSRAVGRRREMGMRSALGASTPRLVAQVLLETLVLAVAGGALGLILAQWGGAGLRRWFLPGELTTAVITDGRTMGYTALATVLAGLLAGLVPAWHAGRRDVSAALQGGSRAGGSQRSRLRTILLVVQPALCVVLLVGAGLFVRSLRHVEQYRLGFDVEPVLLAVANARGTTLSQADRRDLNERMLSAAEAMPGVTSVSFAASVPFWSNESRSLYVPGVDSVRRLGRFLLQAGSPDYFRVMGTRILRGRGFDDGDREGAAPVAVVGEGMARVVWGGDDAIGQCFRIGSDTVPCATVVGIAEDMRIRTLSDPREFTYYLPAAQFTDALDTQVLVRVDGSAAEYVQDIQRRLQREMPGAAYVRAVPLSSMVEPRLRSWRFGATMFTIFGGLALVLAGVGLYSMIAYDVAQRTRDLGVRIALGAPVSRLVWWVLARGARLVLAGVVVGGAVALWGAPLLGELLFQQTPRDPTVFGSVALMLVLVGLAASAMPALRAARVDPNETLRSE